MKTIKIEQWTTHQLPIVDTGSGIFIYLSDYLYSVLSNRGDTAKELFAHCKGLMDKYGAKIEMVSSDAIDKSIASFVGSKVITTTSELMLKNDWELIQEALPKTELAKLHIIAIRPHSKSSLAYIYITDTVRGNPELVDAYRGIKDKVDLLEWCDSSQVIVTKETIVSFLYDQKVLKENSFDTDSGGSKSRANARELIAAAIEKKATDIHVYFFENSQGEVFFRVDKRLVLYNYYTSAQLLSMLRALYMLGSGITGIGFNAKLPQDADIPYNTRIGGADRSFTLRWQSMPQDDGLKVVLRVLDNDPSSIKSLSFTGMGYTTQHEAMIEAAIRNKKGFILTTGTTSSGKSTSNLRIIYEMLLKNPHWSFYTVEDPIEYRIDGVCQIPVQASYVEGSQGENEQERRKMSFIKILNGLMRQDPDVIGVGEVRDVTTAKIVEDFVNTGHKIIATLHADSALYVFERLHSIGIPKETLCRPAFFSLIVYQSLVPRVCKHCSLSLDASFMESAQKKALKEILSGEIDLVRVHNPDGCSACNGGIKGLSVCAEMLMPDNKILGLIRDNRYHEAEEYWLNEMELVNPHAEFKGKSIVDHMLFKVKKGEACPVISMEEFTNYVDLLKSGRDFSFLKSSHLRGVVNG